MITYAEHACFRKRHLWTLARVVEYTARISDDWGNELRCHELARAVRIVISDEVVPLVIDGKCGPVEHSWLCFFDSVILDPYVPGRLPAVQIIDPMVAARLYQPGDTRTDVDHQIVARLVAQMRQDTALLRRASP